jgi:hypothetical protein
LLLLFAGALFSQFFYVLEVLLHWRFCWLGRARAAQPTISVVAISASSVSFVRMALMSGDFIVAS